MSRESWSNRFIAKRQVGYLYCEQDHTKSSTLAPALLHDLDETSSPEEWHRLLLETESALRSLSIT